MDLTQHAAPDRWEIGTLVAEATGRADRPDPRKPRTGGPAGNARLTAWTGLVLLVLLAVEGVTLIDVRGLITWHVVVGALLVPPALLKTATTGWRMVRYYAGNRDYRRRVRRPCSCASSHPRGRLDLGAPGHRDRRGCGRPGLRARVPVGDAGQPARSSTRRPSRCGWSPPRCTSSDGWCRRRASSEVGQPRPSRDVSFGARLSLLCWQSRSGSPPSSCQPRKGGWTCADRTR